MHISIISDRLTNRLVALSIEYNSKVGPLLYSSRHITVVVISRSIALHQQHSITEAINRIIA